MSYGVFFLALLLSEILGGGPKFTLGAVRPLDAPYRRNVFTQSEYFTISNCVFNFNILTLVVSEILGGPKFTLGGPVPPSTPPSGNFFALQASTLLCVFNFNFLALLLSEILGGPKFTLRGHTTLGRPLAEKYFYPKPVLHNI